MNPTTTKLATLLGTASLLTLADVMAAQAQQMAQATPQEVPSRFSLPDRSFAALRPSACPSPI
jgi:hypothetical protein